MLSARGALILSAAVLQAPAVHAEEADGRQPAQVAYADQVIVIGPEIFRLLDQRASPSGGTHGHGRPYEQEALQDRRIERMSQGQRPLDIHGPDRRIVGESRQRGCVDDPLNASQAAMALELAGLCQVSLEDEILAQCAQLGGCCTEAAQVGQQSGPWRVFERASGQK